ncbi:hypothetical protein LTS18_005855, partial [Coniosporium uncinatum]
LFPLWISLLQYGLKKTGLVADTVQVDRLESPKRDMPWIKGTVRTTVAVSVVVWWYTLTQAPFPAATIFLPSWDVPREDWIRTVCNFVQWDYVLMSGSALLWLGYLFADLKGAGMVGESWVVVVGYAVLATVVGGPGAAVGLGWLWREEVLATRYHRAAVVEGSEVVRRQREVWEGKRKMANGVCGWT